MRYIILSVCSAFAKNTKCRISAPIINEIIFFSPVPRSPNHMGLICVKNPHSTWAPLRGQKALGKQKIQFFLQSSSNVNIHTVWKLNHVEGLKMHFQNIVDGRCLQKEFFKNILLNKVYFLNFANRYILNPVLTILMWLQFLT